MKSRRLARLTLLTAVLDVVLAVGAVTVLAWAFAEVRSFQDDAKWLILGMVILFIVRSMVATRRDHEKDREHARFIASQY